MNRNVTFTRCRGEGLGPVVRMLIEGVVLVGGLGMGLLMLAVFR